MSSHKCPVPGGTASVSNNSLMCAKHWYTVPKPLRSALWRAWRDGEGAGSAEHYAAMAACVRAADATITCSGRRYEHD